MSIVTLPFTFSAGAVIIAAQHNSNFTTIYSDYNGNIQNVNIASNAGIPYSKLTLTGSIIDADVNSSAAITNSKLNLATVAQDTTLNGKVLIGSAHQGDIFYDNGTQITRLTPGTAGQVLQTQGASANPQWGSAGRMILCVTTNFPQNSTSYSAPSDVTTPTTTLANHVMVMPFAATIRNLYVTTTNNASNSMTITVYKNASSQSLAVVLGSTATSGNDTTHSFTVAAGDTISFENTNPRLSAAITSISVEADS